MSVSNQSYSERVFDFFSVWFIPFGLLVLLAGLPIIPDRDHYIKLYYWFVVGPAVIALCLRPGNLGAIARDSIVIGVALFSLWTIISIAWTDSNTGTIALIKRPVYILLLFAACALTIFRDERIFFRIWTLSSIIVLLLTLYGLIPFIHDYQPGQRFTGTGGLYNPLLSSHIFGFFMVFWISWCLFCKNRLLLIATILCALCMFAAVLATGSRTPLVALSLTVLWLCLLHRNRQAFFVLAAAFLTFIILLVWFPETLFVRGTSYRIDLWQYALEKISERPVLGYGLDSSFGFVPENYSEEHILREPHSFILSVFYITGVIGLLFWCFIHLWALWSGWKNRHNLLYVVASGWLIFGIGAGLTEGAGIFSRPKEHWFLVWIPLAFIAALNMVRAKKAFSDADGKKTGREPTPICATPADRMEASTDSSVTSRILPSSSDRAAQITV